MWWEYSIIALFLIGAVWFLVRYVKRSLTMTKNNPSCANCPSLGSCHLKQEDKCTDAEKKNE